MFQTIFIPTSRVIRCFFYSKLHNFSHYQNTKTIPAEFLYNYQQMMYHLTSQLLVHLVSIFNTSHLGCYIAPGIRGQALYSIINQKKVSGWLIWWVFMSKKTLGSIFAGITLQHQVSIFDTRSPYLTIVYIFNGF